ncbi:MAG: PAS domain S-box protein [Chloracidobacterium sp.]|nr:PAS domain S-box protein [Chloracidobacterium sp.]
MATTTARSRINNKVMSQTGMTRVTTRTLLLLFIAFLALGVGVFNLRDRLSQKPAYSDGVLWRNVPGRGVVAERVEPDGPAALAGVWRGDILIGISTNGNDEFDEIDRAEYVQMYIDQAKDLQGFPNSVNLHYLVQRLNDSGNAVINEGSADLKSLEVRDPHIRRGLYLALIGLIYLGIGVYFLLKQGRAPYVTRFFIICLLSFIWHFYSTTEQMRTQFDNGIDLTDTIAVALIGPFFIHFAALYPLRKRLLARSKWLSRVVAGCLYAPTAILITGEVILRVARFRNHILGDSISFRYYLYYAEQALFAGSLVISAALFIRTFILVGRQSVKQPRLIVVRQQLKWVIWGMSVAATAFTVFYVPAYLASTWVSSLLVSISIAPFILVPLTLGYSVVRYRLSDIDIVMRRSMAYISATLSVAAIFGLVMAAAYQFISPQTESPAGAFLIAAVTMAALAMLFSPVKNWAQERIDRAFYGGKYDYRATLQEFGRALASTIELEPLLNSLMRRLKDVLSVERLAIFIEDTGEPSGFRVARAEGVTPGITLPNDILLTLRERSGATGVVQADEPWQTGAEFELDDFAEALVNPPVVAPFSYYAPCAARSRVVAVLALGRPTDGALLTSEDTSLLRAISGYVAVAIENALLLEEQARRAKELARLKEFNENIVESISVGVMVINLRGRITNWNSALEQIYGLKREDVNGRRITEVFQSEMLHALRDLMERGEWRVGEPVNVYKFRARSADGRDLTLNISLAALQSKTAEIEGSLVAIEDVTERVGLEAQLQQSDKLSSIGLLAAGVAHEVNTPLAGISSYSQMLMQQIPDDDPRRQLLEKIHRQTSRASSIVNNLLNFSRVTEARYAPVDLNRVIDDTIQLLEAQLRNTEIEVVRSYADELPPAFGDAPKLQQVLMNLMLNARDAMPQGGRLEISTEADDDSVVIAVRDNGLGIAPEHLAKIYDPFFTTKQIGKGTGLGLAVSYGIISDHGGHIDVESNLGVGTRFQITLPLAGARQMFAAASD